MHVSAALVPCLVQLGPIWLIAAEEYSDRVENIYESPAEPEFDIVSLLVFVTMAALEISLAFADGVSEQDLPSMNASIELDSG